MTNRIFQQCLLAGMTCVSSFTLPAQTMDPVVVTATRTEQSGFYLPVSTTSISSDTIEQSNAKDIAELLRMVAGIDVVRDGGTGQKTSIFIRGTESNHVLVMIDGVKINPGTLGQPAIQNIHTDQVERIEIIKGPGSTLYGSDAIGGVINIITKRADKGLNLRFSAEGGEDSTKDANAAIAYADDDISAGIDISFVDTDGIPTATTSTTDRGHKRTNVNTYVSTTLGAIDIELRHWQAKGNTEYTSFGSDVDQDFDNRATALELGHEFSEQWASTFTVSHMLDNLEQQQSADYIKTTRMEYDWQNDIALNDANLVTLGIHHRNQNAKSLSYGTSYDDDIDETAVYVQDDIHYNEHQIIIGARYLDHEAFGNHTTWNFAYGYPVTEKSLFFFNAGTAFRAPDSTDRFGFGGNPNLDPEKSKHAETGIKYRFNDQQQLSASIFYTRIDELITYDFGANQVFNIEQATIKGIDAAYRASYGPFTVGLNAVIQNPVNDTNDSQLARRAKRSLTTSLGYSKDAFSITLENIASGDRPDSDFNTTQLGGYSVTNLLAQYQVNKAIQAYARIENLFDKNYTVASGFNTPDQKAYIGIKANLDFND